MGPFGAMIGHVTSPQYAQQGIDALLKILVLNTKNLVLAPMC